MRSLALQEQKPNYTTPVPQFTVRLTDGISYAVFKDECELVDYAVRFPHHFDWCRCVSYDGYFNAFQLGRVH